MAVQYTVCDVELPYPVIFTFPGLSPYYVNVKYFIHDLIPDISYTSSFPYPGLFPYNIKY